MFLEEAWDRFADLDPDTTDDEIRDMLDGDLDQLDRDALEAILENI
jgi:hypothetical protein